MTDAGSRHFAVCGLGTMGSNLALNVLDHGYGIAVWNRDSAVRRQFAEQTRGKNIVVADDLRALVGALERPRQVLLMVPAGKPVDSMLADLTPLLSPRDMVLDGGNSWYADTERRERELAKHRLRFYGVGISGGEEGARFGPSLMPGGDPEAWPDLRPLMEDISAKTEAGPCVTHVGPGGAGHFVKMVHNGIEYADMQLIAEVYDVLKRGCGMSAEAQADVFERWNEGPLRSFLIEITTPILRRRDERGEPLVEQVLDKAGQKGTGRWTVSSALELGVAVPSIAASVDARVLSADKASRVRAEKLFGKLTVPREAPAVGDLEAAMLLAKVASYAQGFELIRVGSRRHEWNVDRAELARIWKGGCIIRARLLDEVRSAHATSSGLENLLLAPSLRELVVKHHGALRSVVSAAVRTGIPVPVLSASLAYIDALRTGRLPQNLIQAQRDAFGAHTYARIDDPTEQPVHTDWLSD